MSAIVDAFRTFHNAQLKALCEEAARPDLLAAYEVHAYAGEPPSAAEVAAKRQKLAESERVNEQLDAIFARRALPTMSARVAERPPPLDVDDEALQGGMDEAPSTRVSRSTAQAIVVFRDAIAEFTTACGLTGYACDFGGGVVN